MKRILVFTVLILALGAGGAGFMYYQASDDTADAASDDAGSTPEGEIANDDAEGEEEDGETAVPVSVVDAAVGSVSTYITATANLVPEDEVVVLAEAEGRVDRLEVEEGDHVAAGQLLASLLQEDERMAYDKAEVRSTNAELAYERAVRMHSENLISQEEYDKTVMDHRIAQQELAEMKLMLDRTEIRAPFSGRVTWRNITLGQHIRPGDELFRVTDFDPLISRIYLPEKDVLALQESREVKITLKADDTVRFRGRIQRISPVVDTATGTVKVTIEALEPPDVVRPGGFVIIDIVRETRPDAMVLPREAVVRELKSAHVFVVNEDVAEKRAVKLGLEEDEQLEIVSGVEAGEQIVVAGQGSLKDGSRIKVLDQDDTAQALNEPAKRLPSRG
jgi:RND family efflux transporter MFP subunit